MNPMDPASKKFFIQYLTAFSPLSEQELQAVLPFVSILSFKAAETYLHAGADSGRVGLVLKGVFRVFYLLEDGKFHVRRFSSEGRIVGDMASTLAAKPARVTIDALTASEVAVMQYRELEALYESYPGWQRLGRKLMEYYYRLTEEREYQFLALPAKERYQQFRNDYPGLEQRISQAQIASYLGINPVTLSRIRSGKAFPK